MASGLPIVGSRSGGMPELVPTDCGVLIDAPADWDIRHTPTGNELAVAITTLLPGLSAAATAARHHAVEHYGVAAWIEAHDLIFQNLRP